MSKDKGNTGNMLKYSNCRTVQPLRNMGNWTGLNWLFLFIVLSMAVRLVRLTDITALKAGGHSG